MGTIILNTDSFGNITDIWNNSLNEYVVEFIEGNKPIYITRIGKNMGVEVPSEMYINNVMDVIIKKMR